MLTHPTFASVSFAPFEPQIGHPREVPYRIRYSPSGVRHCSLANHIEDADLVCASLLTQDKFEALDALIGTQGTLTASQGSCTAILIRCDGTPFEGNVGGGLYLVNASLAWIQVTPWS
jgi:hypothetical protein